MSETLQQIKRCAQCWKEELEVKLEEKTFRQNGEMTKRWFCIDGSCYGHYMMGLEG